MTIKRALLSVWNKEGIEILGAFLHNQGIELISTGGTQSILKNNGIPVTNIENITGSSGDDHITYSIITQKQYTFCLLNIKVTRLLTSQSPKDVCFYFFTD